MAFPGEDGRKEKAEPQRASHPCTPKNTHAEPPNSFVVLILVSLGCRVRKRNLVRYGIYDRHQKGLDLGGEESGAMSGRFRGTTAG
jgi:hypothetical protein